LIDSIDIYLSDKLLYNLSKGGTTRRWNQPVDYFFLLIILLRDDEYSFSSIHSFSVPSILLNISGKI